MIQRIQTVFLLVVVGCLIAVQFFPYWTGVSESGVETQFFSYAKLIQENGAFTKIYGALSIVSGLSIVACIVAMIEIFVYKNRVLQMILGSVNTLFLVAAIGTMAYVGYSSSKELAGSFDAGIFILGVAMVCNTMARKFIQKDDQLVKSVDRLR